MLLCVTVLPLWYPFPSRPSECTPSAVSLFRLLCSSLFYPHSNNFFILHVHTTAVVSPILSLKLSLSLSFLWSSHNWSCPFRLHTPIRISVTSKFLSWYFYIYQVSRPYITVGLTKLFYTFPLIHALIFLSHNAPNFFSFPSCTLLVSYDWLMRPVHHQLPHLNPSTWIT